MYGRQAQRAPGLPESRAAVTWLQRHVQDIPAPDFINISGAGIQRLLVAGDKHHVGVLFKYGLRSIAVVHIKINDRDTLDGAVLKCVHGADRHVVQQAEAHCLLRFAVVARRPDNTKCPEGLLTQDLIYGETQGAAAA